MTSLDFKVATSSLSTILHTNLDIQLSNSSFSGFYIFVLHHLSTNNVLNEKVWEKNNSPCSEPELYYFPVNFNDAFTELI